MKLREAHYPQVQDVDSALWALRKARDLLKRADCPQAVKAVRRALKSVEGAKRHIDRRFRSALYPGGVIVRGAQEPPFSEPAVTAVDAPKMDIKSGAPELC